MATPKARYDIVAQDKTQRAFDSVNSRFEKTRRSVVGLAKNMV